MVGGGGYDTIEGGLGNDYIETTLGSDVVLGQWGDDEFSIADSAFVRIDGQHGEKRIAASQLPNTSSNKLLVSREGVDLSFVGTDLPGAISDVEGEMLEVPTLESRD